MFDHNRITTGRIASNHLVRIALVAVVIMSAIGASGALAQPVAAEPGSHSGITDDDSTYIQWPQDFDGVNDDDPTYTNPYAIPLQDRSL